MVKKFENFGQAYRKAAPYVNASYSLIASVALFGFLGWWLDDYFQTLPVIFLIFLFLGLGSGFYGFYKAIVGLEDKDK